MQHDSTGVTKRDQIADALRRLILAGEYPRGERLPQDALAERFGVSITPVREALQVLQAEGLVISEPRRGVRVLSVDPARVAGIYVMRRLAEPYAMKRATVRISRLELRAAGDIAASIEAAARLGDAAEVRRLNRAFHFHFYERCGVPALSEHIASLWSAFPWDLLLGSEERIASSHEEHREILAAVESGDLERVDRATWEHIHRGYLAVSAVVGDVGTPDPFEVDAL
ncbi:hypothetical protein BHE97_17700 [Aeromicrobium sp. PE09-221]|uniref:GntR family transcriptional regulator n=1 Tax=Aeromicrobium sp. PE09-221 TaxID=1898043 RepID=UPI000B3EB315|nr:GntR family transcriptional regulator [Aeromicrobium sp. PE09-221]OUZ07333.1 hypothetical protein BHE97_17700 [Aeromicrobium sp. PE09-221]